MRKTFCIRVVWQAAFLVLCVAMCKKIPIFPRAAAETRTDALLQLLLPCGVWALLLLGAFWDVRHEQSGGALLSQFVLWFVFPAAMLTVWFVPHSFWGGAEGLYQLLLCNRVDYLMVPMTAFVYHLLGRLIHKKF